MILGLIAGLSVQSCSSKSQKKIFKSNCNDNRKFITVGFEQLMDSLANYDQQYVEVLGRYEEGRERSALVSDSLLADHTNANALWVDFSQDCPLYLSGTHKGLFEFSNDGFTRLKNKTITIRGMVNLRNKGHLQQYKGAMERVSYIKL